MPKIPLREFTGLDPIGAIKLVMQKRGLSRADLEPIIGSRGRVSEIMNRNRDLSLAMIRALHRELKIPASVLIRECAVINDSPLTAQATEPPR